MSKVEETMPTYVNGKVDYVPIRRNHVVNVKLTPQELEEIARAAQASGVQKATYLRSKALEAARKQK